MKQFANLLYIAESLGQSGYNFKKITDQTVITFGSDCRIQRLGFGNSIRAGMKQFAKLLCIAYLLLLSASVRAGTISKRSPTRP